MTTPDRSPEVAAADAAAHAALCADLAERLPLAEGLATILGYPSARPPAEPGHAAHTRLVTELTDTLNLPAGVNDIFTTESGYAVLLDDVSTILDLAAGLTNIVAPLAPVGNPLTPTSTPESIAADLGTSSSTAAIWPTRPVVSALQESLDKIAAAPGTHRLLIRLNGRHRNLQAAIDAISDIRRHLADSTVIPDAEAAAPNVPAALIGHRYSLAKVVTLLAEALPAAAEGGGPLVHSELAVPEPRSFLVARPRLTDRLAYGTRGPVTLVIGPAGAGKTQLVASWATAGKPRFPLGWVTLEDDGQSDAFWAYILEALRRAGVETPGTPSMPQTPGPADRSFLVRLATALAVQPEPVVLVLDGVAALSGQHWANDLDFILRHAGGMLRLVLVGRSDPPLPLHRYRLAGQLQELRSEDLAFTDDETAELLALHRISLSREARAQMLQLTEGWAAGLQLFARALADADDAESLFATLYQTSAAADTIAITEPLSERERDVLQFLPTMLTANEIATSLGISVNTVKTHMRAIFRKLGATRRSEAVERARQIANRGDPSAPTQLARLRAQAGNPAGGDGVPPPADRSASRSERNRAWTGIDASRLTEAGTLLRLVTDELRRLRESELLYQLPLEQRKACREIASGLAVILLQISETLGNFRGNDLRDADVREVDLEDLDGARWCDQTTGDRPTRWPVAIESQVVEHSDGVQWAQGEFVVRFGAPINAKGRDSGTR